MKNKFSLQLSKVTSTDRDRPQFWALDISDPVSSMTVLRLELDPDQALRLLQNERAEATGDLIPDDMVWRVGRQMEHGATEVPSEFNLEREVTPKMRAWAGQIEMDQDWDTHEFRRTNTASWRCIFRRWREPEQPIGKPASAGGPHNDEGIPL